MRQIHYVVKATIKPGENNTSENFKLPIGFTTAVAVYTNGVEKNTGAMPSVEMKDDNSIAIIPMVHIDNWRQTTGGEYERSFKPLNFDTGNKDYSLLFALEEPLAGDIPLKFHVVFLYNNTINKV
ncbi:hypothetical protein [Flavobacterium aquatile]|uniref:Uncharacterized protein n=1 Tax=Flavobacterium aquatile LMG 4008 = ATCC 11947 TaxID=1453498 RepID=A0A095UWH2_9FLAO|nr:hypothetical protein [Flavobacterium aquatile]KGD66925.1 hypothetical protein LG45_15990 [Flavobacterium aquatile LMG 4008 = ATCC 11947]OXA68018.1 hypothetical protein B0A61_06000 [Flavobacterium aquatile LMG 4008 = ATCC 11947]GEC80138.1 hypothetical protein FAQ01_30080 [Flavobacterium aquatile]